jgi:hypothetical protein
VQLLGETMSREPSNSDEPAAGAKAGAATPDEPKKADSRRTKHIVAGAAIGIGSAALVAALLYANRSKKTDKA